MKILMMAREPGQMSEDQIRPNRNRFYPEIEWADLNPDQRLIKDATVEMFLKTLELISTFHPYLSSGQLLEVESLQLLKKFLLKSGSKSLSQKERLLEKKKKISKRKVFSSWREWFGLENTQQAIVPVIIDIYASFIGWSLGISKNSCNPTLNKT